MWFRRRAVTTQTPPCPKCGRPTVVHCRPRGHDCGWIQCGGCRIRTLSGIPARWVAYTPEAKKK